MSERTYVIDIEPREFGLRGYLLRIKRDNSTLWFSNEWDWEDREYRTTATKFGARFAARRRIRREERNFRWSDRSSEQRIVRRPRRRHEKDLELEGIAIFIFALVLAGCFTMAVLTQIGVIQ